MAGRRGLPTPLPFLPRHTGEVPAGRRGKASVEASPDFGSSRPFTARKLSLGPSPPPPTGAPPPSDAGLSGESLSIMECQLVGRISRSSPGGIGSVWFADVRDGSSGEQASPQEFGEADGPHLETAVTCA